MLKKKKSKDTVMIDESNYENYPTNVESYSIVGQIGKGAFAAVYKAICKEMDNQEVALKVIELEKEENTDSKDNNNNSNWEEIQKEAAIMRRMHHPNIVSCHAVFTVHTELWLVLPFLKGGSCSDLMKSMKIFKNGFKDEDIIATILNDVLNGIHYCHNDGRIHRDIKSANILLSAEGVAQLSDFGVSGAIIEGGLRKAGRDTFTGSLWWMAPEVLQRENKHSFPADIWSLGVTALELAYGKPPHATQRPVKVMLTILQSPAPSLELFENEEKSQPGNKVKWSKDFRKFLSLCLQKDSEKRATAKDLLKHAWFKHAKEHSYIVENVLKDAPELKVNKNRPLPQSIQPKENNKDENHGSINFIYDTDTNLSAVIKKAGKENKEDDNGNNQNDANGNENDNNNDNNNNNNNNDNNDNTNNDEINANNANANNNNNDNDNNGNDNNDNTDNNDNDNNTNNTEKKPSRFAVTYEDDDADEQ